MTYINRPPPVPGDFGGELLIWDSAWGHGRPLGRVGGAHDLGIPAMEWRPGNPVGETFAFVPNMD